MGVRRDARPRAVRGGGLEANSRARGRAGRAWPAAVAAVVVFLVASPAPQLAQSGVGELDPTFGGGDGRVNDNFDGVGRRDQANAVVVQPDGKIVVAVEANFQERGFDFGLARYNPDGTPDASFGAGGKVTTDFPFANHANDLPYALALQPDGKIIAAGTANLDFALARYNPDGSLDQTFGAAGLVTTDFFANGDTAFGVLVQPDGKIVAAGSAFRPNSTGSEFAAARYNADGSPDTTFGDASATHGVRLGRVATDFESWNDTGRGVALQADGKIVVAGYAQTPSYNFYDFALLRYRADGTLDPSFGGDGRVTTYFFDDDNSDDERAYAVRVQPDGRIVAAGFARDNNETQPRSLGDDFALARYNADGTPDASFGDGLVVTNIFVEDGGVNNAGIPSRDRAHALLLQPDGKLVAGGFASCCSSDGTEDFALVRYNPDGAPDPDFGRGDGIVRTDFFGRFDTDDEIYGMALEPEGRIVAAGRAARDPRVASYDYALARYRVEPFATPTPTPAYTVGGNVRLDVDPIPGVTVTLAGSASATAVTDAAGNYSFAGLPEGGDYTVTASRDGYTFSPPNHVFRDLTGNRNASFAAQPVVGGGERVNVALASRGGVASASSTTSPSELPGMSFPVSSVNNGDRRGLNWEHGGGWRDGTDNAFPDWVQVTFDAPKSVDEINVFGVQDDIYNPSEPTLGMTFSAWGVTAFEVQFWTGTAWAVVPGGTVAGNNFVWRRFTFAPVTTDRVLVLVSHALARRSRLVELEAWGRPAPAPARLNAALASNGGVATASSTTTQAELPGLDFSPAGVINGDRRGLNWEHGGGWRDATNNAFPDWLQIDFSAATAVDEIGVFSLQDNYSSPAEPTEQTTFTKYGVTSFVVQYWDGAQWATVPGGTVINNSSVWRKLSFPAVTTTKVRVVVNSALAGRSRLVEVEAWGTRAAEPPTRVNHAAASNGGAATASSTTPDTEYPGLTFPVSSIINGDRKGLNWECGGGWRDATNNAFPDWVEVQFAGARKVDEVSVFSLQDSYTSPSEPTEALTFTKYGVTSFEVQFWDGAAWATVPGGVITNNGLVWRKLTFPQVTTTKVRVVIHNGMGGRSRLVEVEAVGPAQ